MERKLIQPSLEQIPDEFHALLSNAAVYDSSCSPVAQVLFIEKDQGYFLKSAEKGTLQREAEMTRFFHEKQLGAEVLTYRSSEKDWLLTEQVQGEDCTHPKYLADPKRLCDTSAEILRRLHDIAPAECPVPNRIEEYLALAEQNYRAGKYDADMFPEEWRHASVAEAWKAIESKACLLKNDTLIHGDYCLPNVILNNWKFSGFIDVDHGGVGDRHIDLFWGIWSLGYNLRTDKYKERFLDAYGRERVDVEVLKLVAAVEAFG